MSTSSPPSSSDASTAGATPALEKQLALSAAPTMTPLLSATQRLQLLYALTTGDAAPTSTASCSAPKSEDRDRDSVLRRLASLQSQLLQVVSSDRGLKRFINDWSKNSSLLGLGYNPPSVNALTIPYDAQLALCLEMEPDLSRSLAQLEEIQQLEARNVLDSKSLAQCETLAPRLLDLVRADEETQKVFQQRQARTWQIAERYHTYIDTLSQLFIALDEQLARLETDVARLERKQERSDVGLSL